MLPAVTDNSCDPEHEVLISYTHMLTINVNIYFFASDFVLKRLLRQSYSNLSEGSTVSFLVNQITQC